MASQFSSRADVVYRRTPGEVKAFAPWRMASERGTWTGSWTEPDGKVQIGGSYFAKWRQLNGRWFISGAQGVRTGAVCPGVAGGTLQAAGKVASGQQ